MKYLPTYSYVVVLPRWFIEALKKAHKCDDAGILQLMQDKVSQRITKVCCREDEQNKGKNEAG